MIKMNEYRCYNCHNILCKATDELDIEIICSKCRRINYPARKKIGIGLRGKDFNTRCINNNCPQCKRLLLKTIGYGFIELKCCNKKCNWIGVQDTLEIRRKISNLTKVNIDKLRKKMDSYIIEDVVTKKVFKKDTDIKADEPVVANSKPIEIKANEPIIIDNKPQVIAVIDDKIK